MFLTNLAIIRNIKRKRKFAENHFLNIMKLMDVLTIIFFTIYFSCNYYVQAWYIRVASLVAKRLKTYDLRKLGKIRKLSYLHTVIASYPASLPNWKFHKYWKKPLEKEKPFKTFFFVRYFTKKVEVVSCNYRAILCEIVFFNSD